MTQALSVALAVTEQQQFAVCEALALAPRELLLEDGMYSGTDSDEEGPVPADGDEAMAGSATPTRAEGVSPANTTSATPAEQESATAREAAAQQLAAGRSSTRGGMVLGDDSGRTVLSAFLEHLVTKNSGATRSVQEVGLSGIGPSSDHTTLLPSTTLPSTTTSPARRREVILQLEYRSSAVLYPCLPHVRSSEAGVHACCRSDGVGHDLLCAAPSAAATPGGDPRRGNCRQTAVQLSSGGLVPAGSLLGMQTLHSVAFPCMLSAAGLEVSGRILMVASLNWAQGLEFGRESEADRYGDMARLGGTCGHLLREFPPAGLDHSPVPVLLVESTAASEHSSPSIPLSKLASCHTFIPSFLFLTEFLKQWCQSHDRKL